MEMNMAVAAWCGVYHVRHGRMHIYTEEGWFVSHVQWMARKYEVVVLSSRV